MTIKVHTPLTVSEQSAPVSIFLAGSIDNGSAEEWQNVMIEKLEKTSNRIGIDFQVNNPRRENWDKDCSGDELKAQIYWELNRLEMSDIIFVYFAPDSLAPISLLELGLHKHDHIIVYCPKKFYRNTNVEVTCEYYDIPCYDDFQAAYDHLIDNAIMVSGIHSNTI